MAEAKWTPGQEAALQEVRRRLFEFFPREKVSPEAHDETTFVVDGLGKIWLIPAPEVTQPSQLGAASSHVSNTAHTGAGGWPTWTFAANKPWSVIQAVSHAADFLRRAKQ